VIEDQSTINQDTLQPEQAAQLLQRQDALQHASRTVLEELNLISLLSSAGTLRQVGSSVLGLMVWRDIDLSISSPGLTIERAYEIMRPFYTHPRVKQIRYLNGSGPFNPTGLQVDERYYFAFLYDNHAGNEWKIDISFWLGEGVHPEPMQDELERELTPETRLAILWIKDIWYRLPAYRSVIYITDIYNAVLHHGVRTPAQFDQYLANHGKSTRSVVP